MLSSNLFLLSLDVSCQLCDFVFLTGNEVLFHISIQGLIFLFSLSGIIYWIEHSCYLCCINCIIVGDCRLFLIGVFTEGTNFNCSFVGSSSYATHRSER